jgi:hypothetical protein
MGNVAETMQKNLIGPATSFVADPLSGLGVGGKKEAFVAKVGEPLTFVELWVRQWVDVFDKKHGTWCVAKIALALFALALRFAASLGISRRNSPVFTRPHVCLFRIP